MDLNATSHNCRRHEAEFERGMRHFSDELEKTFANFKEEMMDPGILLDNSNDAKPSTYVISVSQKEENKFAQDGENGIKRRIDKTANSDLIKDEEKSEKDEKTLSTGDFSTGSDIEELDTLTEKLIVNDESSFSEITSVDNLQDNITTEDGFGNIDMGGGDALDTFLVETQTEPEVEDIIKIKKCRIKIPIKGEKFHVKFVDNVTVPHKLFLKNRDKVLKHKLNTLLARKLLQSMTNMPMSRLEENAIVLVRILGISTRLSRGKVKWIQSDQKIEVQDIDTGSLYRVTSQDIFVLDDEQIAKIYPLLFVCTLPEFDGKDIFWNNMIRDLYLSTLRYSELSIEVKAFRRATYTYELNIKLLLDDKKFININEWLGNSLIPYLTFLKTCPSALQKLGKQLPEDIFFPYVKLLKE